MPVAPVAAEVSLTLEAQEQGVLQPDAQVRLAQKGGAQLLCSAAHIEWKHCHLQSETSTLFVISSAKTAMRP